MEKQLFIELLHKYLKGESTVEEDELLISYYNLFEHETDVMTLLTSEKKEILKKEIYSSIQEAISRREKQQAKIRSLPTWVMRSAAAAVLIAAVLVGIRLLNHKAPGQSLPTAQVADKKQNRLFHLPDGSVVLLSYGSTLNYPTDFKSAATRDVYLDGQAYFDIHHDESRPFLVHTDKIQTRVLGTAFNIKAIKGQPQITVTVTRGKVKVSDENKTLDLLTPDQQIVYDKGNGTATKNKVNAWDYLQWKDEEDLVVDNVTFEEAAKLLEDKFKIAISFKDADLKKNHFTTVLLKKEGLEQTMKSICEFNGAVWKYDKNKTALIIRKSIKQ